MKSLIFALLMLFSIPSHANERDTEENNLKVEVDAISTDIRPWWVGDLLTVISILSGFGLIVFQLSRQHSNDIETQKENNRDQFRLEVYEEFSKELDEANNITSDAGMYVFSLKRNITIYIDQTKIVANPQPISERADVFKDLHFDSNLSIIKLIKLIEKYEIVSPELDIFKTALNVASHDISKAFIPLITFLLEVLPMDTVDKNGNNQIVNIIIPNQSQLDELNQLIDIYKNAHDCLGNYLYDFNVELQKLFLSKLFKNEVKEREPIDPKYKVVSTDPDRMAALYKYFEEETAWGNYKKEIVDDVKKNL